MTSGKQLRQYARKIPLGKLVGSRAGKTPSRGSPDFWGGTIPWLSAKDLKSFHVSTSIERITSKAVQDGAPLSQPGDILILVRGMTLLKDVPVALTLGRVSFNQDVRCLNPGDSVSGEYLAHILAASRKNLLSLVTHAGHGTGRLDSDQLLEWPVPVPPREIQDWLVAQLRPIEESITRLSRLLTAKRAFKRALMQELLTGRRRFREFGGEPWEGRPLGHFLREKAVRNGDGAVQLVYSCSKLYGIIPQSNRFKHRVAAKNVTNYKIVEPGDLVFDPMLLWDASIGFVPPGIPGVVSPAYTTLSLTADSGSRAFLAHALFSHYARHMYRVASRGTNVRRKKVLTSDFLRIRIPVPPTQEEQIRVAAVLDAADREIQALLRQRELLGDLKRGLMQRLLSGDLDLPDGLVAAAPATTPDAGGNDDDS